MRIGRIFECIFQQIHYGQFKMGLIGVYLADPVEIFRFQFDPRILLFDKRLHFPKGLLDEQLKVEFLFADRKVVGFDGGGPQEPLDLLLQVLFYAEMAANEGHSLDHRENRVEFLTRVARFLEDSVK